MSGPRSDPVPAARALLAALPALIEQARTGGLTMPVYCMGLALDEARRVIDEAEGRSGRIMSTVGGCSGSAPDLGLSAARSYHPASDG